MTCEHFDRQNDRDDGSKQVLLPSDAFDARTCSPTESRGFKTKFLARLNDWDTYHAQVACSLLHMTTFSKGVIASLALTRLAHRFKLEGGRKVALNG